MRRSHSSLVPRMPAWSQLHGYPHQSRVSFMYYTATSCHLMRFAKTAQTLTPDAAGVCRASKAVVGRIRQRALLSQHHNLNGELCHVGKCLKLKLLLDIRTTASPLPRPCSHPELSPRACGLPRRGPPWPLASPSATTPRPLPLPLTASPRLHSSASTAPTPAPWYAAHTRPPGSRL